MSRMSQQDGLSLSDHSAKIEAFEDSSLFSEGRIIGIADNGDGGDDDDGEDISNGDFDDHIEVISYEVQNDQSEATSKIYDLSGRENSSIQLTAAIPTHHHQIDTDGKYQDENDDDGVIYDLSGGGSSNMTKDKYMAVVEESPILSLDDEKKSIASNVARLFSRHPRSIIASTLIFCILISVLVVFVGKFKVEDENKKGWKARGTVRSKRGMQSDMIENYTNVLFNDSDGDQWEYLTSTVQEGYFYLRDSILRRIPLDPEDIQLHSSSSESRARTKTRHLLQVSQICDSSWYSSPNVLQSDNVYALWKSTREGQSLLRPDSIQAICSAEEKTIEILEEKKLCGSCSSTGQPCLYPLSLILVLRQYITGGEGMECSDLASEYSKIQESFTQDLVHCSNELRSTFGKTIRNPNSNSTVSTKCPPGFSPLLLHKDFGVDGRTFLSQSTSYFHTAGSDGFELFAAHVEFGHDSAEGSVAGAYETNTSLFSELTIDSYVGPDLVLAAISGCLAFTVIAIHTSSLWLVLLGTLQIVFAIPFSYFVYYFVFRLRFFSLINFIGFFVSAALGADDLFVASDKWKNYRVRYPRKSTGDIAALALPEAASAMLLTTSTTAVAFFATCLSPVAPIFCFAVFCGLMIVFNYVLNCLLVFPGLCMYDEWMMNNSTNCLISFGSNKCRRRGGNENKRSEIEGDNSEENNSIRRIQRVMDRYYRIIHAGRWPALILCLVGLGVSTYFAQTIRLPEDNSVRMLSPSHPLEEVYRDYQNLLSSYIQTISTGTPVEFYFGVLEKDTGDYNNPDTLSTLELDETFEPGSIESQQYLLDFCNRLFSKPFVYKPSNDYKCSINKFDDWLRDQWLLPNIDRAVEYNNKCKGTGSLPMPADDFHSCFIYWSQLVTATDVLQWEGRVKILTIHAGTRMNLYMTLAETEEVWDEFEVFQEIEEVLAPQGVNQWFHTSPLWWGMDTFQNMIRTGRSSLYISIGFAFIATLVSSKSLMCSIVASLSIFFILVAATATLVGLGWELGFLELVCFAILVGISSDFVIHFTHSYTRVQGTFHREGRTRYALVNMGPSIVGATVTTFAVAFMMLFCKIVFFIKFAQLLIVTICYALLGSFVFFVVIMDIFGPESPTAFIDKINFSSSRKDQNI